jgi:hypothetical protein
MTDIEQKALALVNEVARELNWDETKEIFAEGYTRNEALFRAIEQHEAFKQTVSDAILRYLAPTHVPHGLKGFIIPKPKPDALAEVIKEWWNMDIRENDAETLRELLEARGLEIRSKAND